MKEEIKLLAHARTETGSKAVNRLRKTGLLPGVVYGVGTPKNVTVAADAFSTMQRHHASENLMVRLEIEGDETHNVLLREVQHHPLTSTPLHVDFYEVDMSQKVRVSVPVELIGIPVGVSVGGGLMEQLIREIEIECLPDDIPEGVELDVSGIEVGDRLTVEAIPLDPSRYTKVTSLDIAVASVAAARVADGDAEAGGAGEPEVLGAKPVKEE